MSPTSVRRGNAPDRAGAAQEPDESIPEKTRRKRPESRDHFEITATELPAPEIAPTTRLPPPPVLTLAYPTPEESSSDHNHGLEHMLHALAPFLVGARGVIPLALESTTVFTKSGQSGVKAGQASDADTYSQFDHAVAGLGVALGGLGMAVVGHQAYQVHHAKESFSASILDALEPGNARIADLVNDIAKISAKKRPTSEEIKKREALATELQELHAELTSKRNPEKSTALQARAEFLADLDNTQRQLRLLPENHAPQDKIDLQAKIAEIKRNLTLNTEQLTHLGIDASEPGTLAKFEASINRTILLTARMELLNQEQASLAPQHKSMGSKLASLFREETQDPQAPIAKKESRAKLLAELHHNKEQLSALGVDPAKIDKADAKFRKIDIKRKIAQRDRPFVVPYMMMLGSGTTTLISTGAAAAITAGTLTAGAGFLFGGIMAFQAVKAYQEKKEIAEQIKHATANLEKINALQKQLEDRKVEFMAVSPEMYTTAEAFLLSASTYFTIQRDLLTHANKDLSSELVLKIVGSIATSMSGVTTLLAVTGVAAAGAATAASFGAAALALVLCSGVLIHQYRKNMSAKAKQHKQEMSDKAIKAYKTITASCKDVRKITATPQHYEVQAQFEALAELSRIIAQAGALIGWKNAPNSLALQGPNDFVRETFV